MAGDGLPEPQNNTDVYLREIVRELRKINARAEPAAAQDGVLSLREPAPVPAVPPEPPPRPSADQDPAKTSSKRSRRRLNPFSRSEASSHGQD